MRNTRAFWRREWALGIVLTLIAFNGGLRGQSQTQTGTSAAEPSGYFWGALVRASNRTPAERPRPLETGLVERLEETFPFRYFQLLGEHTQPVSPEYEAWVLPSEELYMKVDSKGPVEGGLGLHLQLWRRQNVILKTDVILSTGSPIFITGPKWGDDQLLLVVQLREQQ